MTRPDRFSPAFRLVAACCAGVGDPGREAAIREAASTVPDWAAVEAVATNHRTEGLVAAALKALGLSPGPGLAAASAIVARRSLHQAGESVRLDRLLRGAGLSPVFLKGSSLAILAFGRLDTKSSWDIDLLLSPEQAGLADTLLRANRYRRVIPSEQATPWQLSRYRSQGREVVYRHEDGTHVELHCSIGDAAGRLALGEVPPIQAVPLTGGAALTTLAPDTLYAYLCHHGTRHLWSRLKWLADLHGLLRRGPLGPSPAHAAAVAHGVGRESAVGLLCCAGLFGLPLAPELERSLRADPIARLLADLTLRVLQGPGETTHINERRATKYALLLTPVIAAPGARARLALARQLWASSPDRDVLGEGDDWRYHAQRIPAALLRLTRAVTGGR